MKHLTYLMLFSLVIAAVIGCDSTGGSSYEEQIVLQGMMYVGYPLRIRLTHTLPLGTAYDARAVGVTGANVHVSTDSVTYLLTEEASDGNGDGFYSLADSSISVIAGGHYSIRVEAGEHILDAETVGAGPTEILFQSADTVEYGDNAHPLRMRWQTDSLASGYVAMIENLEPDWFEDYRAVSGNNGPDLLPWNLWVIPPTEDSLRLPWVALGFTGRHRLRLMTCDRNLWNYMWTYYPPGQSDVTPVSNIHGGLGIFAVGGVDTTYFMLTDTVNDGPKHP
jgi:hypothetical protein